jgi:prepilin-type N-terminal cleavage/methylation domain-containing protein
VIRRDREAACSGFTLLETVIALAVVSVLVLGVGATLVAGARLTARAAHEFAAAAGAMALYDSVERAMADAASYRYQGHTVWITEADGNVASYRVSAYSHLLLRSQNGYGAVVESTDVSDLNLGMLGVGGLVLNVRYSRAAAASCFAFVAPFGTGVACA